VETPVLPPPKEKSEREREKQTNKLELGVREEKYDREKRTRNQWYNVKANNMIDINSNIS
jgi:hypothetical protein